MIHKSSTTGSAQLADETLRLLSQSSGGADVRALCINLDRRPERWEAFKRNCPIRGVDRFPAIKARGWLRATPAQCERLQATLWEAKAEGLARAPEEQPLTLRYHDLLASADRGIDRVIAFQGLRAQARQRTVALRIIAPELGAHACLR